MKIKIEPDDAPAIVSDLRDARVAMHGHAVILDVNAGAFADGTVGIALKTNESEDPVRLYMPNDIATKLSKLLLHATYEAGRIEHRLRGAHVWRFERRSGRLLAKHDDREFWIEPTTLRATTRHRAAVYGADGVCRRGEPIDLRACVSCGAPLRAGMIAYREVEPGKKDWRARSAWDRTSRICGACVAVADEPAKTGLALVAK